MSRSDVKNPLLHILVIGFHHKKGGQVEFSYPPLVAGTDGGNECPIGWKYLPTLALPDGSHNYEEDSVFFNLPSLDDQNESVYGVSCYRQIPVEQLKIRTADVTRSTVQKSVCALISIPIYGYIEVKLSLIAQTFFEQGDFSSVQILIDAYNQLNACLLSDGQILSSPMKQIHVGLNLRDLILKWRHKILLLFKLFLLQKRIVCFGSPVRQMCSLILGIASLHPLLIEKGFKQVACVRTSRPMSPMPDFTTPTTDDSVAVVDGGGDCSHHIETKNDIDKRKVADKCDKTPVVATPTDSDEIDGKLKTRLSISRKENNPNVMEIGKRSEKMSIPRDASSVDALASASLAPLCSLKPHEWNAPLPIFLHGNLCLPYLSLPYMDLLSDSSVLGYVIGTSNILFQQKKQLADVYIDVEGAFMETQDQELRRQLQLTTEDLRLIDFIIRHVTNPKEDAEGSETWIREQFLGYMVALLKTSLNTDLVKDVEPFNSSFMSAFKKTQCYQEWSERELDDSIFDNIPSGHPFAGTLSVADMKLRLAQTIHNTESGRKLNQAVNTTSKAVGGALSQAKGAFSNWWSSITTSPPVLIQSQSIEEKNSSSSSAEEASEEILTSIIDNNSVIDTETNDTITKLPTTTITITSTTPPAVDDDNDDVVVITTVKDVKDKETMENEKIIECEPNIKDPEGDSNKNKICSNVYATTQDVVNNLVDEK